MTKGNKLYLKAILLNLYCFPALLFSSCVPLVSDDLVQCLNDKIPPVLAIDHPSDGVNCANIELVSGRVSDLATDRGAPGVIKRLFYQIPDNLEHGEVTIQDGGTYCFPITTDKLDGSFILQLTAVDWHNNTTTRAIPLYKIRNNGIPSFKVTPGNKELILEWEELPHTASYTIIYSENGSLPSAIFSKQVGYITSRFTLKPLDNGKIYILKLEAKPEDENWPSSCSDFVKAIPLTAQTLTPQVESGYKKIDISWNPIYSNLNDSAYQVWKSVYRESGFVNISGDIISPKFTDTEVEAGRCYYYKIIPAQGNNIFSNVNGAEPSPFPDKPYIFTTAPVMQLVYNIAIADSYAYVNSANGIEVMDIKNPLNILPVKFISIPDSTRTKLVISGSFGYLPNFSNGMQILDIHNPYEAGVVKTLPFKSARDVAIRNSYAYVVDATSGLQIIDINDPYQPKCINTDFPLLPADNIVISGSYAYLAKRGTGLYVLNLSNPKQPVLVKTVPISNFYPWRMAVSGSYLYIADANVSLYYLDINDPTYTVKSLTTDGGGTIDMALSGSFIYLTDNRNTIQIIDITNPGTPRLNKLINSSGTNRGLAISDFYAYVTCSDSVQIMNINNPRDAMLDKTINLPGYIDCIAISGNYVYATNHEQLWIVDLNRPDTLPFIPVEIPAKDARDLAVSGPYVYIVDAEGGLEIIDVRDPAKASIIKQRAINGAVQGVAAAGAYTYVVDTFGLKIIDVSDPVNAFQLNKLDLNGLYRINVYGPYAFIAAGKNGLYIVDISTPQELKVVGTENDGKGKFTSDVVVSGNYAYLAVNGVGVEVIDISNPEHPVLVKTVESTTSVWMLNVSGFYLYAASLDTGLQIIDISNPPQASLVKTVGTNVYADDVVVSGAFAYLADSKTKALQIIKLR